MKKNNFISMFIKFGLVGVINTLTSLIIYYIIVFLNSNLYILGTILGYIISSLIGYFLNKNKVFKTKDLEDKKTLIKYYIVYVSALLLNVLLMKLWVEILGISSNIAPILTLFFTTPYNFIFSKFWIFKETKVIYMKDIKNYLKKNFLYIILCIIFATIIAFVLGLNIYNHPAADDYSNVNAFYSVLGNNEMNIINIIKTIFTQAVNTYKTWQGTYFCNILFYLNPLLVSLNVYKFSMIMIQLFFFSSIFYLIFSIKKVNNNISNKMAIIISMISCLFSISFLISQSEGLYWFTGTIMYLVPFSISLYFLGVLIRYLHSHEKVNFIVLFILVLCLGGTSYVTGLFVGLVLLLLTFDSIINKKDHRYYLLTLLIVFVLGFSLNVFCPGNFNRISNYSEEKSIIIAIARAFPLALNMIKYALFDTLLIPLSVLLIPAMLKIIKQTNYEFKYVYILPIMLIMAFVVFYMPCTYSYNSFYEETRVKNIQLLYFVIMFLVMLFNTLGYMYQNKILQKDIKVNDFYKIGVIMLIMSLISLNTDNFKTTQIMKDVIYGDAKHYNICMNDIHEKLKSENEFNVIIKNCAVNPISLHTVTFTNNETDWIKEAIEKYYNKEIIVEE